MGGRELYIEAIACNSKDWNAYEDLANDLREDEQITLKDGEVMNKRVMTIIAARNDGNHPYMCSELAEF